MLFKKDTELNECYRFEQIFGSKLHIAFLQEFLNAKMQFLQKFCQNFVNVRYCKKFAKFAILVQACKILVRNAKLARSLEEFCKICDFCNLG